MKLAERITNSRRHTDELLKWLRGKGKTVIVVHDNPDPDCLASAMALRHLLVMKLNVDPVISFSGIIGRSENIVMAKELEIALTPLGLLDLRDFQVVCMLDTQPGTGNNSLPPGTKVDIIIDHHPLRETSCGARWVDVRDDYGVTATILYEYLVAQDVYIGTKLATALFYAIKSETQDLGREAGRPDREAYLALFPLTNKKLLYEITHPKHPKEYFLTVNNALQNARIYGSLLVSNLYAISFPELVAEMADLLLQHEGVETVLCMGLYNEEMTISMRTIRPDLNTGEIIRRLVAGIGTAGGHGMMAGGKVDRVPNERRAVQHICRVLTTKLLAELGIAIAKPIKLLG